MALDDRALVAVRDLAIHTLRRAGLRHELERRDDGYALTGDVQLMPV